MYIREVYKMSYTEHVGYNIGQNDDLHLFEDAFSLEILINQKERNGFLMISSSCVGMVSVCLGVSANLLNGTSLAGRVLVGLGVSLLLVVPSYLFATVLYKCCNEMDNNI